MDTIAIKSRPKRWLRRLPAVLFLGIASYMFLRSEVYFAPKTVRMSTVPLQNLSGAPVSSGAVEGKAVVLNFWAPWCPPCREEMPSLDSLQQDHPDVAVIGVEDDADQFDQAKAVVANTGVTYLMVRTNQALRDRFGQVAGLPTTLYISASGKVVHTVSGVVPESVMQMYLRDATDTH